MQAVVRNLPTNSTWAGSVTGSDCTLRFCKADVKSDVASYCSLSSLASFSCMILKTRKGTCYKLGFVLTMKPPINMWPVPTSFSPHTLLLYPTSHSPSSPISPSLQTLPPPSAVDSPRIITQPLDMLNIIPGNDAVFNVTASGLRLTYTWMHNGSALPSDGRFVAVNETLTIRNVNVSDVGNYSCLVSNAAGNDTSDAASLTLSELCMCVVRDETIYSLSC